MKNNHLNYKLLILCITLVCIFAIMFTTGAAIAQVSYQGDRVFIVDRTGYSWDVTQARQLGFKPEGFQYGIGKDAFTPLDQSGLDAAPRSSSSNPRIIGIKKGDESHAYSVSKLWSHEIANTTIDGKPVAAGY